MAQRRKKPKVSIRRPKARPRAAKAQKPAAVDRFVATGDASGRPKDPAIVALKTKPSRRRTTVYFPPELARRLKIHAVTQGVEISEVVTAAVIAHLAAQGA